MPGATDLALLLAELSPSVRPGEVVVVTRPVPLTADELVDVEPWATIVEGEGTTYVVVRAVADERGWDHDGTWAWITLEVRSSLAAVGLTAAVATALAEVGIAANVLAAFHHDHVLVPSDRVDEALAALRALSRSAS